MKLLVLEILIILSIFNSFSFSYCLKLESSSTNKEALEKNPRQSIFSGVADVKKQDHGGEGNNGSNESDESGEDEIKLSPAWMAIGVISFLTLIVLGVGGVIYQKRKKALQFNTQGRRGTTITIPPFFSSSPSVKEDRKSLAATMQKSDGYYMGFEAPTPPPLTISSISKNEKNNDEVDSPPPYATVASIIETHGSGKIDNEFRVGFHKHAFMPLAPPPPYSSEA